MTATLQTTVLWTALVTPFSAYDLKVDYKSLEKLLRLQEAAGAGVLLLGSTGESLSLDEKEKLEILHFALEMKLRVPIMVGVGGIHLPQTQKYLADLEKLPLDAYLMVTPLYAKPGPQGQYHWFKTLLDQSSRPCMLYNVPSRAGAPLRREALALLKDHPRLWAIKEASGSIQECQDYKNTLPGQDIFCGDDGLMPFFATAGSCGLVSVASNPWPKETLSYVKLSLAGKTQDLFPVWRDSSDSLFTTSNPVPVKALLHELGIISSAATRPPLSADDLGSRKKLIDSNQQVRLWAKNHLEK